MGNTLMQHRLAIAGFKMPGMKLSWRKRMKKFKNTIREERAGRKLQVEARNGMMMLTKLVVLPLICALPRLWMSTQGESFSTPSLHSTQLIPSSTSCLGECGFGQGKNMSKHKYTAEGLPCSTELVYSRMVPSVWLIGHFWSWMIFW